MSKLIMLRGYPGAGKATIGKALQLRNLGKFIDHHSILTFVANITGDDAELYNEIAELELAMTRKLLKSDCPAIVARGFSSLDSMKPYEDLAAELNVPVGIFRIDVDYEELARRVQGLERAANLNPTTSPELLEKWISENPLVDHEGEIIINNTRAINEVVNEIVAHLEKQDAL